MILQVSESVSPAAGFESLVSSRGFVQPVCTFLSFGFPTLPSVWSRDSGAASLGLWFPDDADGVCIGFARLCALYRCGALPTPSPKIHDEVVILSRRGSRDL